MIARLVISPDINQIKEEINKTLILHSLREASLRGVNVNHPDVLYFQAGAKLGSAEARKIKEHLSLKPYSAKGIVIILEDASVMTPEAQNALLKTLEELAKEAILILGASSDANLLPTILSRCQIIRPATTDLAGLTQPTYEVYIKDLEKLLNSTVQERFQYIEKLKNREEFLRALIYYFRDILLQKITNGDAAAQYNVTKKEIKEFLKELLQAEQWVKQNVNIRAILEYLMLRMSKTS